MLIEPLVEKYAKVLDVTYSPGSRVFHIVFSSKDPMVGFDVCASLRRKFGLTLLDARYTRRAEQGDDWSVFVQDGQGLKLDELRKALASVEGMEYVSINQDSDGVIMDKFHFPPTGLGGERVYIMTARTLQKVFQRTRDLFGTGGEAMIFEEGATVGSRDVEEMSKVFGVEDLVAHFPAMPYFLQVKGVGKPEVVKLDYESLNSVFRISHSAECEGQRSSTPYSRWVKGQLVGFMSALFKRQFKGQETKCVAMGDPYCEFHLSPI